MKLFRIIAQVIIMTLFTVLQGLNIIANGASKLTNEMGRYLIKMNDRLDRKPASRKVKRAH